jgi:protein-disulfide isomerase
MTPRLSLLALTAAAALSLTLPAPVLAQSFSPAQRTDIEAIVKNYLISHPEVLHEALKALEKQQADAEVAKHEAAVKQYSQVIFHSPRQVVLGNPNGDVTMVEFFDYNCGFCKRAMADMLDMLNTDPKLRIVLKEFPVLGQGSVEAANIAVAVRMQDKTGKAYLDFHRRLLGGRGHADKAQALAAAKAAGLDMARIEKDSNSPEVKTTLTENFKVADALGLTGTPSYVIGDKVVVGAVGLAQLKEDVNKARCGKTSC